MSHVAIVFTAAIKIKVVGINGFRLKRLMPLFRLEKPLCCNFCSIYDKSYLNWNVSLLIFLIFTKHAVVFLQNSSGSHFLGTVIQVCTIIPLKSRWHFANYSQWGLLGWCHPVRWLAKIRMTISKFPDDLSFFGSYPKNSFFRFVHADVTPSDGVTWGGPPPPHDATDYSLVVFKFSPLKCWAMNINLEITYLLFQNCLAEHIV